MALTTAFCTSAKVDLLAARHNFLLSGGSTFKAALYTDTATFGAATTAYTATNEVAAGNSNYTAGGMTLTRIDPSADSTTAITDFADVVITVNVDPYAAFTVSGGMMIYNDTLTTPVADASVSIHAFTGSPSASGNGATFTITFPAAAAATAIIRIA